MARVSKVWDWMWLLGGSCTAFWDQGTAILARTETKGGWHVMGVHNSLHFTYKVGVEEMLLFLAPVPNYIDILVYRKRRDYN